MLDLAARDPQALWSLTADIPPSLTDTLHKLGVPANQELDEMLAWIRQANISQGMDAASFTLRAAVLTDEPEHASAFSGLIRMGQAALENMLREAASKSRGADAARAREGLAMLSSAVNRAEGDTLFLRVSVPQKTIIKLINDERAKGVKKPIRKPRRRARRR
jgi:hypothetical protein